MDKSDIKEAVMEAMIAHRSIDAETHHDHHAFITLMMERETRRLARVEKFKTSFIGAVAVAAVGALGWLGQMVIEGLQHHK